VKAIVVGSVERTQNRRVKSKTLVEAGGTLLAREWNGPKPTGSGARRVFAWTRKTSKPVEDRARHHGHSAGTDPDFFG